MNSKIIMKCLTVCLLFIGSAVVKLEGAESEIQRMRRTTLIASKGNESKGKMTPEEFFSKVKKGLNPDEYAKAYAFWTGVNLPAKAQMKIRPEPEKMTSKKYFEDVPSTYRTPAEYGRLVGGTWENRPATWEEYGRLPMRPSFYQRHRRVIGGTAFLAALALGFYYRASLAALVGDREAWNKTMQNAREKGVLHIVREYFNKHGAASWESIKNWRMSMPSFSRPEWTQGLGSSLYNASANAASYLRGSAGSIAGGAGAYWLGRRQQQPAMPMQQPMPAQ